MSSFIRCPSCALTIGRVRLFFDAARSFLYEQTIFANTKIHPENVSYKSDIAPELTPIFETLDVYNICCRMHLSTLHTFIYGKEDQNQGNITINKLTMKKEMDETKEQEAEPSKPTKQPSSKPTKPTKSKSPHQTKRKG